MAAFEDVRDMVKSTANKILQYCFPKRYRGRVLPEI